MYAAVISNFGGLLLASAYIIFGAGPWKVVAASVWAIVVTPTIYAVCFVVISFNVRRSRNVACILWRTSVVIHARDAASAIDVSGYGAIGNVVAKDAVVCPASNAATLVFGAEGCCCRHAVGNLGTVIGGATCIASNGAHVVATRYYARHINIAQRRRGGLCYNNGSLFIAFHHSAGKGNVLNFGPFSKAEECFVVVWIVVGPIAHSKALNGVTLAVERACKRMVGCSDRGPFVVW